MTEPSSHTLWSLNFGASLVLDAWILEFPPLRRGVANIGEHRMNLFSPLALKN
jgi:hypothetical protein